VSLASNTSVTKFSSNTWVKPCKVNSTLPFRVPLAVSTTLTAVHSSFISPIGLENPFLPVKLAGFISPIRAAALSIVILSLLDPDNWALDINVPWKGLDTS